jgi:FtsZ-binding cell division protein ZapB
MIELLKRLLGVFGTEEIVDGASREADKIAPQMGRKILVTIVAASIGALTSWALVIDGRVYDLQEAVLLKQTVADAKYEIQQNREDIAALERRLEEKANLYNERLRALEKRFETHLEKTK